jgi:uncharacterized membrane protein
MKTVKSYFNEENRLNKGYRNLYKKNNGAQDNPDNGSFEGFGNIDQDSLKQLIEIAKKEQDHQHSIEQSQIRSKNIFRYVLLLSSIIVVFILSFFSLLIITLNSFVGIIFVTFAFGSIISIASYCRMSVGKHYKPKFDNRHYKA